MYPQGADEAMKKEWLDLVELAYPHFYFFKYWRNDHAYYNVCKLVYIAFWGFFGGLFVCSLSRIGLQPASYALLAERLCADGRNGLRGFPWWRGYGFGCRICWQEVGRFV